MHADSLSSNRRLNGGGSTLTWDDVDAMRAAFKAGEATVYELAEFYGIGKSQVHNILTGHNWPDPNYEPAGPEAIRRG